MPGHHISLRADDETFARLEKRSKRAGQSRSRMVNTLLEEGLRMEEHPGIVFRSGPQGRRPGLAGGPDVWEVARVLSRMNGSDAEQIRRAIALTGLTDTRLRTAGRYYAEYADEIDAWIQSLDEEAERAERAWRRQHDQPTE